MATKTLGGEGEWGEMMCVGRLPIEFNTYSGGWIIRHPTKAAAKKACDDANKRWRGLDGLRRLRPEKIPSGKLRSPCEIERVMLLMRRAMHGNAPVYVADAACAYLFKTMGWGEGLG